MNDTNCDTFGSKIDSFLSINPHLLSMIFKKRKKISPPPEDKIEWYMDWSNYDIPDLFFYYKITPPPLQILKQ